MTSLTDLADLFAVSGSSKGDTYCSYSEKGFVWSSTAANATALQKGGSGVNYITGTEPDVSGAYTGSLSETLTAGTTYYYRAYVKNNGDIVKYYPADNILSFTPQSVTFNSNGHAKGMRFRNESEFEDFVSYLMALVVCGGDSIEKI